jgi:hypothetical protein
MINTVKQLSIENNLNMTFSIVTIFCFFLQPQYIFLKVEILEIMFAHLLASNAALNTVIVT